MYLQYKHKSVVTTPLPCGEQGTEALNVLLYLVRGELPSSTRGQGKGEGLRNLIYVKQ